MQAKKIPGFAPEGVSVVVVQGAGNNANQLDEQLLNKLSGGESITVRTLYKTHGREQPVPFTLMMLMNF